MLFVTSEKEDQTGREVEIDEQGQVTPPATRNFIVPHHQF